MIKLFKIVFCIVLATAKIHILKQFTTALTMSTKAIELCLLLQRYTFWSNSQQSSRFNFVLNIVLATAKIHILKQFTTAEAERRKANWLCLLLQRYTFWSNSQRADEYATKLVHCACYCKDTHFEAIHNMCLFLFLLFLIVLATAKIHILKQFTTSPVYP